MQFKATIHQSYHSKILWDVQFNMGVVVDNGLPVNILHVAHGKHTSFYYIKTNSEDTCDRIKLNKASSVCPMLTLDDKSYHNYLFVTWFYYVEKNRPRVDIKPC